VKDEGEKDDRYFKKKIREKTVYKEKWRDNRKEKYE